MTITTVGYELNPKTLLGKLIGGFCALSGIFILTLPIPIVVNSFAVFYKNRLWRNEVGQNCLLVYFYSSSTRSSIRRGRGQCSLRQSWDRPRSFILSRSARQQFWVDFDWSFPGWLRSGSGLYHSVLFTTWCVNCSKLIFILLPS